MIDWAELQRRLVADMAAALRGLFAQEPDQRYYAAALHGSYRELDGTIGWPALAANSLQALGRERPLDQAPEALWSAAWNPPEWQWSDVDFHSAALEALGAAVERAARNATRAQWLALERQWLQTLAAACRELQAQLRDQAGLAPDFVVFLHEEADTAHWLRACVGEAAFARLFPGELAQAAERERVLALPVAERVEALLAQVDRYDGAFTSEQAQDALCALGAAAVPALRARLPQREGWRAAMLLARIGQADDETVAALRAQFSGHRDPPAQAWAARALALSGDREWLFAQLARAPRGPALEGLCAPYTASRDPGPCRLDYAPLQRLLSGPAAVAERARELLKPGTGYCRLRADEIDAALQGLAAPQAFVRAHAAAICDDRGLGAADGARLLPALARCVATDPDAQVRFLAALSLGYWKREAAPWSTVLAAACEDADERVRRAARGALEACGQA